MWSPRERVERALTGRPIDHVPFTAYYNKFFLSREERELRNAGFCPVELRVPVYHVENPDVEEQTLHFRGADGVARYRTTYRTPAGTISETFQKRAEHPRMPQQLLPWHDEYLFKGPEDYAPIEFLVRHRQYVPNFDAFRTQQEEASGDAVFVAALGYSPLLDIIYTVMGLERFAIEWADRRDDVLRLYEALAEDHRRKMYPMVAESPALIVDYCGNISQEVIGLRRFEQLVRPLFDEFADLLHARGKLLGVHFDGRMKSLAPAVAASHIDFIEAFTPAPNGDMSVAEARAAWPDKALWINFPSSAHLESPDVVEETARGILREAAPGHKFLIGITETVPSDRWQASFLAIMRAIQAEGRLPVS
jgi:hypothetical protein